MNKHIKNLLASILEHQAEIEHDLAMIRIVRPDVAETLERIRNEQKDLIEKLITEDAERANFEREMFEHVEGRSKPCDIPNCQYCGTWADHLRDQQDEPPK